MYLILLFFIFATALFLHFVMVRYSHALGLIDTPNERSIHTTAIPRSGGIAIFFSIAFVHMFLNLEYIVSNFYIFFSISAVFLVGLIDDRYDTSPKVKFIAIFFATILLYFGGVQVHSLGTYFGYEIILPALLIFPFTFFAIAGFTNALNLIDGLDGLAGTVSLIIFITFLGIGIVYNDAMIITLSLSFIAALLAFLFFNWNPAKIFMGDSGSLTLGFVIGILCILSAQYVTPTSVLFIIALPLLDTFIVMTRRFQRKQPLFKADKNHIHHFLYNIKLHVRFTVILLLTIQASFSIIGFQLREEDDFLSLILFSLLFFTFLNLFDQRQRHRHKGIKGKRRNAPKSSNRELPTEL